MNVSDQSDEMENRFRGGRLARFDNRRSRRKLHRQYIEWYPAVKIKKKVFLGCHLEVLLEGPARQLLWMKGSKHRVQSPAFYR